MNAASQFKPAEADTDKHPLTSTGETGNALRVLCKHLDCIIYRGHGDIEWSFVYLSGGCRSLTGFDPKDLLHNRRLSFESLIHPDDRYHVREQRAAAIKRGHNYDIQ